MESRLTGALRHLQAAFLVLLLAGCAAVPLPPTTGLPPLPQAFKSASSPPGPPLAALPEGWWQVFNDPELDQLVARATAHNASIAVAAAQLARARALVRSTEAARSPRADVRGSAGRQGGPLVNAAGDEGNLFTTSLTLAWEADLLGRLEHGRAAAGHDADARRALLRDARLLVQIDLVRQYLALHALDAELVLARQQDADIRAALAIAERRVAGGQLPRSALVPLRLQAAQAGAEVPDLVRRRAQRENALAVLLGEPAPAFALAPQARLPAVPAIPAGVPVATLTRRPDVAAALDTLLAARERVGQAAASGAPDLQLAASGGLAASGVGSLLALSARTWSLGALGSLPLFDGGRREAAVQVADADFQAAQAGYRARYLGALQDVEDQLALVRSLEDKAAARAAAADASREARAIADRRLGLGLVSEVDLLDARQADLRQQRALLQVHAEQLLAAVDLVRALGGGWE